MDSVFFNFVDKAKVHAKIATGEFPFSKYLFWDTQLDMIDNVKHKRSIIERVITRGKLEDVYALIQMYSNVEISDAIIHSRILDSKTANFCSIVFNIPKSSIHVSSYYG